MASPKLSVIILGAGLGRRMRSDLPKVVISTCERPMIQHVVEAASSLSPERIVVVTGHRREMVEEAVQAGAAEGLYPIKPLSFAIQKDQLGTGDAVKAALPNLEGFSGDVLILYGDVPLLRKETLKGLLTKHHSNGSDLTIVTAITDQQNSYGRIVRDSRSKSILKVVETKDCTPEEFAIKEVNVGIYLCESKFLKTAVLGLKNQNAQKEYYLTDIVEAANGSALKLDALIISDISEVQGVNDRIELGIVNETIRNRRVAQFVLDGVEISDPRTTYIDPGVTIASGVKIGPNVQLIGETSIAAGVLIEGNTYIKSCNIENQAVIKFSCHLEDSKIGAGASVGPFARIRPGSILERDVKIGNFVETKKAHFKEGAKASHLSYLGDCTVGKEANVGAGTITCNYDGYKKSKTTIGDGAFIGSNTSLVAPVEIGAGATVGAGSVITKNVEPDALAVTRAPQVSKPGWSKKKRESKA